MFKKFIQQIHHQVELLYPEPVHWEMSLGLCWYTTYVTRSLYKHKGPVFPDLFLNCRPNNALPAHMWFFFLKLSSLYTTELLIKKKKKVSHWQFCHTWPQHVSYCGKRLLWLWEGGKTEILYTFIKYYTLLQSEWFTFSTIKWGKSKALLRQLALQDPVIFFQII